ncbi:jg8482 [Pararge aegeria aegeria]|uniref:Jg8482 protein n=1 Tax=Pararge aegeria aegeria TaxID=348720 RepID=A0A8S4RXV1_9NEOP|nr:jg8482 [Pararge aegeria aegeria]
MLGLRLSDRQRNAAIRKKTQLVDHAELACKLKWRWAGHVARSKDVRRSERATGGPVTKAGRAEDERRH